MQFAPRLKASTVSCNTVAARGEAPWETILGANIVGMRNVFEAARLCGVKRVVWASSNHTVGFYRRDETIDHTVYPQPDSRYGVSKVFV